ncbi:MAG: ribose-phosphate pyrophosphokinase [Pseudomonadota bacterium]|nr:ribose-phosphate pyrophosphokinase [Pseudomonadota bacterium]|tara:strand:- start:1209 stop:2165 length:957 start_codon:yes stop_codon:yes gene_type:complete
MSTYRNGLVLFSGNGNRPLAEAISKSLRTPIGQAKANRFSDGEISIDIQENVRGKDVYLIQPTCAPANDNLMELIIMVDAIRRSSAGRITAVIPYYGYGRQDRRVRSERMPISAKVMADILERSGIDKVLTVELHSEQIQGFFHIPVDNVYGTKIFHDDIITQNLNDKLIVSPDVGGVIRSRALAKVLGLSDLAIIDKRRDEANKSEVMNVIGDVKDKDCIIVDDMVDTAGTLCNAATALKKKGARKVLAYTVHPVLSGTAIQKISKSDLDQLIVTDSIPLSDSAKSCKKIRTITLAPTLAEAIRRLNNEESISAMFL